MGDQPGLRPTFLPHKPRKSQVAAAHGLVALQRMINASLRFHFHYNEALLPVLAEGPIIYSVWHNNLFASMAIWKEMQRISPARKRRLAALISASRDGAFLSEVLSRYQVEPVRGSSSRRGAQALIELTRWVRKGCDVAITPDGPRGPRHKIHDGILSLAQLSHRPILPVSVHYNFSMTFRSWDLFQVPWPFTSCHVWIGNPLPVPRMPGEEEKGILIEKLRAGMSIKL